MVCRHPHSPPSTDLPHSLTPLPRLFLNSLPSQEQVEGCLTTKRTITPGSGPAVTKGATVTVHATGVVKETSKKVREAKRLPQRLDASKTPRGRVTWPLPHAPLPLAVLTVLLPVHVSTSAPTPTTLFGDRAGRRPFSSLLRLPPASIYPPDIVLVDEGPRTGAIHVPGGRRRCDQGLGPGLPRHAGRRDARAHHPRGRRLRRGGLPGLGHPARRHPQLHPGGQLGGLLAFLLCLLCLREELGGQTTDEAIGALGGGCLHVRRACLLAHSPALSLFTPILVACCLFLALPLQCLKIQS